jgi:hypothetical protein
MSKEVFQEIFITEFVGKPPEISIWNDVDKGLLEQGDPDPMYVTLKVAEINAISGNGRQYPGPIVESIKNQLFEKRPTANPGHIKDEDRAYVFPTPAGYWVGATMEGQFLWAKAYVPHDVDMRETVRRLKATNSKIATSIYGTGSQIWDADRGLFVVTEFDLEHIDFAPADRAGIKSLGMVPHITTEMDGDKPEENIEENNSMDKLKVLSELTAADAQFIPQMVRESIQAAAPEVKLVAELRGVLGNDADVVKSVREMQSQIAEYKREAVKTAIAAEVAKQVIGTAQEITPAIKNLRETVAALVDAQKPQTIEAAAAAVAETVKLGFVAERIQEVIKTSMGGNQEPGTHGGNQGGGSDSTNKWLEEKPKSE